MENSVLPVFSKSAITELMEMKTSIGLKILPLLVIFHFQASPFTSHSSPSGLYLMSHGHFPISAIPAILPTPNKSKS